MIDLVTGNKPLPTSIQAGHYRACTDGIPLFVEEFLTKAVLEAESPEGGCTADRRCRSILLLCCCAWYELARIANGAARPARSS